MNQKIQWLRERMKMLELEGMIISNPVNVRYLTNITTEGILLITRKENVFLTDGRYIEEAQNILTIDDEIIVHEYKDYSIDEYENFFMFCENVGFEENYVSYAGYKEFMRKYKINNLQETENVIEKQRMIKDDNEIKNIRKACELTDLCYEHIKQFIKVRKNRKRNCI